MSSRSASRGTRSAAAAAEQSGAQPRVGRMRAEPDPEERARELRAGDRPADPPVDLDLEPRARDVGEDHLAALAHVGDPAVEPLDVRRRRAMAVLEALAERGGDVAALDVAHEVEHEPLALLALENVRRAPPAVLEVERRDVDVDVEHGRLPDPHPVQAQARPVHLDAAGELNAATLARERGTGDEHRDHDGEEELGDVLHEDTSLPPR